MLWDKIPSPYQRMGEGTVEVSLEEATPSRKRRLEAQKQVLAEKTKSEEMKKRGSVAAKRASVAAGKQEDTCQVDFGGGNKEPDGVETPVTSMLTSLSVGQKKVSVADALLTGIIVSGGGQASAVDRFKQLGAQRKARVSAGSAAEESSDFYEEDEDFGKTGQVWSMYQQAKLQGGPARYASLLMQMPSMEKMQKKTGGLQSFFEHVYEAGQKTQNTFQHYLTNCLNLDSTRRNFGSASTTASEDEPWQKGPKIDASLTHITMKFLMKHAHFLGYKKKKDALEKMSQLCETRVLTKGEVLIMLPYFYFVLHGTFSFVKFDAPRIHNPNLYIPKEDAVDKIKKKKMVVPVRALSETSMSDSAGAALSQTDGGVRAASSPGGGAKIPGRSVSGVIGPGGARPGLGAGAMPAIREGFVAAPLPLGPLSSPDVSAVSSVALTAGGLPRSNSTDTLLSGSATGSATTATGGGSREDAFDPYPEEFGYPPLDFDYVMKTYAKGEIAVPTLEHIRRQMMSDGSFDDTTSGMSDSSAASKGVGAGKKKKSPSPSRRGAVGTAKSDPLLNSFAIGNWLVDETFSSLSNSVEGQSFGCFPGDLRLGEWWCCADQMDNVELLVCPMKAYRLAMRAILWASSFNPADLTKESEQKNPYDSLKDEDLFPPVKVKITPKIPERPPSVLLSGKKWEPPPVERGVDEETMIKFPRMETEAEQDTLLLEARVKERLAREALCLCCVLLPSASSDRSFI